MSLPKTNTSLYDMLAYQLQNASYGPLNKFLKAHSVEVLPDNVGDDRKIYNADNVSQVDRHNSDGDDLGVNDGEDRAAFHRDNPTFDENQELARANAYNAMMSLWQRDPSQDIED